MQPGPPNAAPSARAGEREHGARGRELVLVIAAVVLPLVVVSDRAFNIDEPLFLWLGEQIVRAPLDFFGFEVNWYGSRQPMAAVTRNPPGVGYAIAVAASLFGWSERALHLAFVLPAVVTGAATWALARRLCPDPLLAASVAIASPVLLLCASTVMSDVPMLALWLLALGVWLRASDDAAGDRLRWGAGALVAAAVLTKYFAVSLVALFAAHALVARLPARRWIGPLALPLLVLAGFEVWMNAAYGAGAIEQAVAESLHTEGIERSPLLRQIVEGLAFAGGSVAPALLLLPWLWSRRVLVGSLVAVAALAAAAPASLAWLGLPLAGAATAGAAANAARLYALQLGLWMVGGVSLLGLAVAELWQRAGRRDSERWLLGLWLLGTFVFAALVNWTNNGRSNLALAPVAGILIVRRLARRGVAPRSPGVLIALAACGALALATVWSDRVWSNGVRAAAAELVARHGGRGALWFHGHWGLQLYLERGGAKPVDWRRDVIQPGDRLIVASNNAEAHVPSPSVAELVDELRVAEPRWIHTQSKGIGASFNASNLGSLPLWIGPAPPDRYRVFRARREIRYERWFGWAERAAAGAPEP